MTNPVDAYSDTVHTARKYYNSSDADAFYATIWGGENIHIGLYVEEDDSILAASRRCSAHLSERLGTLNTSHHVLDLGSGYGGTARHLASTCGCRVTGITLSEVENERARRLNREQGLEDRIQIVDGSFESVDAPDDCFDAVCSQDAMLHSDARSSVVTEAARVLKPGGIFAFFDIMQSDDCPDGVLQPILDRIHLTSLGTPASYRMAAQECGLVNEEFEELTPHMQTHYTRILAEMESRDRDLRGRISDDYLDNMKRGLAPWIDGARNGWLVWGIFKFNKPVRA